MQDSVECAGPQKHNGERCLKMESTEICWGSMGIIVIDFLPDA